MQKEFSRIGKRIGQSGKKVVIVTLGAILIVSTAAELLPGSWQPYRTGAVQAASNALQLKSQSIITSGAKRFDYIFTTKRGNATVKTDVHVIEVDLSNPNVALNAMSGKNNSIGQKNNILNMVKENKAVAGINGDVYVMANEGAPLGTQITSGALMSSPARQKGMFAIAVTKDRKPVIDTYSFAGKVTAENGKTFNITGMNQSSYFPEIEGVIYSHVDQMYIYTSAWGGKERPNNSATKPTEVLVIDGVIDNITYEVPMPGEIPKNGYILRTSGAAAKFVRENLKIGQPIASEYSLKSETTGKLVDPSSFEMMVGGHTLLVDQGKASAFSRDVSGVSGYSYTSRSAAGYSKDGTKVYLITSERKGSNTGLSLKELQQVMVDLGVYKGINLDGGGSTTMIERPLGNFDIQTAHPVQDGSMRSVSNGIGVFTLAPAGKLGGIIISGDTMMLKGQSATFSLKGYDSFYNPVDMSKVETQWTTDKTGDKAIGTFKNNVFTASRIGQTELTVSSGGVKKSIKVDVVGSEQIKSLKASGSAVLTVGYSFTPSFTATLKNGKSVKISPSAVDWEFVGFKADVNDGKITIQSIDKDTKIGYAIARYDGYGTMIPVVKSESSIMFEDFETSRYAITSQVAPAATTKGSVKLVSDLPDQKSGRALQISYDFSEGSGTKASYAVFGTQGGVGMTGTPSAMSIDVYSDNSNNWMRAEVVDANNKIHYVDIAKAMNWTGWKNVRVNLPTADMKYPVKLKRIYVVALDDGSTNKAISGTVAIDNIKLLTTSAVAEPKRSLVEMNVGNKTAKVDGKSIKLEAEPLLQQGTTYVPLRFVTEAMGSELVYEAKSRRITVLRGKQMMEMHIGKKEYTLDGVRYESGVAPFTRNNRTLIPIRLFSEKLGYKVSYDPTDKKITIQ